MSLKSTFKSTLCIALTAFMLSCNSITPKNSYTTEHTKRDDQQIWFTHEEENITFRLVATCIAAAEMATDYQRALRKYAEYLRLCYYNISQDSVDVDAGVRSLNFIKKLHKDADGPDKLWNEAVKLAKSTQDTTLLGKPIPKDYR